MGEADAAYDAFDGGSGDSGQRAPGTDVVPFGKYKGEPVERLVADTDYCEWLASQTWFRERYARIYQLVVNYGAEPQDSPEHNEMQARFLDDKWCRALVIVLNPDFRESLDATAAERKARGNERVGAALAQGRAEIVEQTPTRIGDTLFESRGWDVVLGDGKWEEGRHPSGERVIRWSGHDNWLWPASVEVTETRDDLDFNGCDCGHDGQHVGEDRYRHTYEYDGGITSDGNGRRVRHRYLSGPKAQVVFIECKPDLGDDYPSVLRQVKHYPPSPEYMSSHSARVVVVRRASFDRVSWDQVKMIFKKDGIKIITEAEITTVAAGLDLENQD